MKANNIRLALAYDGSCYHGWQRQKNAITIQGTIEEKIEMMTGDPVRLIGSGRTDAGVHAVKQVCNFMTHSTIAPEAIREGLNALLPEDIFVREADYVPLEFHARYGARSKTYVYKILNRREPDIFRRHFLWHVRVPLDPREMSLCLAQLKGTHDFSCFRSSGSGNIDPVRRILRSELCDSADGSMDVILEADGFLRHMVRNVVGTLVEVGMGKIGVDGFSEILASRDRRLAGMKAPAHGLYLADVSY
jgi:tRNA pseudouridine38-40 synthase